MAEAEIVLSAEKAMPGDKAEVKASIVRNPGISAYKFTVNYDDTKLMPKAIVPNTEVGGTLTTNLDDTNRTDLQILWYSNEDVNINADLFTIEFDVSSDVKLGENLLVEISCDTNDICNISGDKFAFTLDSTEIEIAEPIPRDIYEDGEITVYDLTLLSRYVTNLEKFTKRQLEAGDVNNDGDVDIKDVVKMAQYLVGFNGVELMSSEPDQPTEINVAAVESNSNGEAYIPVTISNNRGIAGFRFEVYYNPDEIEILDIVPSESFTGESFNTNLGNEESGGLVVTWYQPDDMSYDTTMFTLHVRFREDFTGTSSKISISEHENNICNSLLENVNAKYVSGGITKNLEYPYTINDIYTEGNNVCVNITNHNGQGGTLILASYDDSEAMVQCVYEKVDIPVGVSNDITIELDMSKASSLKAFLWNSIDDMIPLCEKYSK